MTIDFRWHKEITVYKPKPCNLWAASAFGAQKPQIPAGDRRISGHPHLPVTLIPPSPGALSALSIFRRQQSHNYNFFGKKQYKLCCGISVLVARNLFLSISRGRLREKRSGLGFKQSQNKAVLPGSAQRTIKSQLLNPRRSWNFTWI